tara:strand:- start:215 stop:445 length:231 start_codon:yes stop_codon:yes gene_type:complete
MVGRVKIVYQKNAIKRLNELFNLAGQLFIVLTAKNKIVLIYFFNILFYSKGGSLKVSSNIELLCARHNLEKGAKIK